MRILSSTAFVLGLALSPNVVSSDIRNIDSSDIMAEIEFLERRLTDGPKVDQITNSKENAILNYLSSYAVCEGWGYEEYASFVSVYESELQPFSGRKLRLSLLETSYEARFENGCAINQEAKRVFEDIFGNVKSYYTSLKNREFILEAIDERKNEMLRRTLSGE